MTHPQTISPRSAAQALSAGEAILVDVREPAEFSAQHIPLAASIPLGQLEETLLAMHIPADKKLIFQCLSGKRGQSACATAHTCGACENPVYNLEGGISAWKDAGLPVTGKAPTLSIFRQVQIIVGALIAVMVLLGFGGVTAGFVLAGIFGGMLCFAGLTGWCGLAMLLGPMPWNK